MTTKTAKAIGQKFRERRSADGFSLIVIANEADLDPVTLGRIERGVTKVSFENLVRLCDFYGMDINSLAEHIVVRNKAGLIV